MLHISLSSSIEWDYLISLAWVVSTIIADSLHECWRESPLIASNSETSRSSSKLSWFAISFARLRKAFCRSRSMESINFVGFRSADTRDAATSLMWPPTWWHRYVACPLDLLPAMNYTLVKVNDIVMIVRFIGARDYTPKGTGGGRDWRRVAEDSRWLMVIARPVDSAGLRVRSSANPD